MIKNIVIVGGGAAGWLTAGILAANYAKADNRAVSITLVESPDINTIGVGEGTWPTMRMTLSQIGVSETEFLRCCNASFKQGSKFVNWSHGEGGDAYYHPFTIPQAYNETNFHALWQRHFSNSAYDAVANPQAAICELSCAPKNITVPEYAGVLNYGYHLDAGKFGDLLKRHCTEKLGVRHVSDNVIQVVAAEDESIAYLKTEKSGDIHGDLFVDCSGTHCLLLGEHYNIPFKDCRQYSINDTALATQVPYDNQNSPIASATIATAHSAGWTWDIGLSSRRGVGYVYSSQHISDDDAEKELRAYIGSSVESSVAEQLSVRKIKIRAGHREKFWHRNCVAVGMAAGFIEPLEASALALVELSAKFIRDELPMSSSTIPLVEKRFNTTFSYRWEKIIEFLKLHYLISQRRDTAYWCEVSDPASAPDGLKELLELWKFRPPYHHDLLHTEEIFPSASYQYVLYGMGFETSADMKAPEGNSEQKFLRQVRESIQQAEKLSGSLPSNRALLQTIEKHELQKI
ncbi:Dehydrogenase (flavoprotein) [Alteromonadaceae bacterium Bs31]|nr:Dehydrogenase (flavoprotein) [Alteromonadaceae bacterium Bs31]